MPTRQQKAEALIRRAEALQARLANSLKALEPDLIERFSATVLELGVIDDSQLARIFEAAAKPTLAGAYTAYAVDTAETEGLTPALGRIAQSADSAVSILVQDLTIKARAALSGKIQQAMIEGWSVPQLAREIKKDIGLTETQLRWVRNYERELRETPGRALERKLRDRRFDPSVRRDNLGEERIARMVERYREKWINHRANLIAKTELISASNAANFVTWSDADARGEVPSWIRKFWWHSHDSHVRDSHTEIPVLNPRGVGVQEAFVTPLGRLRYPCDPLGVAEDRVGCRCAVVFESTNPEASR